ncbi:MAG: hypothetical protein E6Q69_05570, partial [Aquipseudomonas alcaligenes]
MQLSHLRWLTLPLLAVAAPSWADQPLSDLFTQGKPILDARYRFENVDQNNDLRDANAQTLRTRAGFQSGQWYGLSGLLEVDNVSRIGDDAYNSTRNGQKEYAVVADPDGTEVNQALLRYDHKLGSAVLGRQRINLDNQRFIGSVAWRQNEQTFDGALTQLKPLDGLTLSYAYLDQINTIWGPENGRYDNSTNPANIDGHSHLINAQYVFMPQLTATAYSYLLDLDNIAVAPTAAEGTLSSQTSGLRLNGVVAGISYALEYAQQKDYGDNPLELDSEYYLAELGYTLKGVQLKAGYEVLGGDNGSGNRAFQTPLATKHAFQGWADQFLTTPADGIEDAYVGVTAPLLGGTLQAWYHDFSTEQGSDEYGNEIDLSYAHPIPGVKGLVGLLK